MPLASSMEPPTIPLAAAHRIVWAQPSGVSLKPFSKSAATGKVVALAIMPALASVSSRDNAPSASGRPRLKAQPALVVARASKPRLASMIAEPASHGLGITKARSRSCKALKVSARRAWASMTDSWREKVP